jgi:hypothetical protein
MPAPEVGANLARGGATEEQDFACAGVVHGGVGVADAGVKALRDGGVREG